ncbi:hypothetical protein [Porphyromonas catoniae]|uniref:hypothetical protein n=1 Tax=Porphyromonas catoniae TaxID=41976 RepID=UPI0012DCA561|nr:hypothetical protein [Porphyromonas catoniae]
MQRYGNPPQQLSLSIVPTHQHLYLHQPSLFTYTSSPLSTQGFCPLSQRVIPDHISGPTAPCSPPH